MTTSKEKENTQAKLQSIANATEEASRLASGEIVKFHQYKNTPFTIVEEVETENYYIVIGDQKVSENMPRELCEELIETKDWNLVIPTINAVYNLLKKINGNNTSSSDNDNLHTATT